MSQHRHKLCDDTSHNESNVEETSEATTASNGALLQRRQPDTTMPATVNVSITGLLVEPDFGGHSAYHD